MKAMCRGRLLSCVLMCGSVWPVSAACVHVRGHVTAGGKPVQGAKVYALAASTAGFGAASVSVHGFNFHHDAVGHFSRTHADGSFDLKLRRCRVGEQVYVLALGGSVGVGGANAAGAKLALVGACPQKSAGAVVVNDVSTVAGVYALGGIMKDATHVASGHSAVAATGIANAFATVGNLVDATGAALAYTAASDRTLPPNAPQMRLNSLANAVASCTSAAAASGCAALFAATTVAGVAPRNTVEALLALVHHPDANVAAVFAAGSAAAYAPALAAAPADWMLPLFFRTPEMNLPSEMAVDARGDIWIPQAYPTNNAYYLTALDPRGQPLAGSPYGGGGLQSPIQVAVDPSGNVWAANQIGTMLSKFTANGKPAVGAESGFPALSNGTGVAVDTKGDVWLLSGAFKACKYSGTDGHPFCADTVNGYPLPSAGSIFSFGMALDPGGHIWIANYITSTLDELSADGTLIGNEMKGGGLNGPQFLAATADGKMWAGNDGDDVISQFTQAQTPVTATGFEIEPMYTAATVTVAGDGTLWASSWNYGTSPDLLYHLDANAKVLSVTASGFLKQPLGPAIDASGNLWISNYFPQSDPQSGVVEFVGAATPVATPLNPARPGVRPE